MQELEAISSDWYMPTKAKSEAPDLCLGHFITDWCLQALNFVRGYLRAKGYTRDAESSALLLWLGWHDAWTTSETLRTAIKLLDAALQEKLTAEIASEELSRIWRAARDRHPDFQARIVMEAADSSSIPYAPAWGMPRLWRFGEGAKSCVLFESSSGSDGYLGERIAASKASTKVTLRSLGLPTPAFKLVRSEDEVAEAVQAIGFPCVTKPIDRGGGKGVSAGLLSIEAAKRGFQAARLESQRPVLIETHLKGEDHRLLVVEGQLVAAIQRVPPTVTGDGLRTIRELIEQTNSERDPRSLLRSGYLRPIQLDTSAQIHLAGQGVNPETVLSEGQTIRVRSNGNLSTGGACTDLTEQVHPEIRTLVESLAQTLRIDMMGADYITTDITRSPSKVPGGFVEINLTPGLDALIAAGWTVEKAGALALTSNIGTIHKTLIIVPDDRLDQLFGTALTKAWSQGVGLAAKDRAAVAGTELVVPQGEGWPGVDLILNHALTERGIILASDQQILHLGMPNIQVKDMILPANLPQNWERALRSKTASIQIFKSKGEFDHLIHHLCEP